MAEMIASIAQLNQRIQGIDTAILTTARSDGTLHSCPMASHLADENGVLWFVTHNNSDKVEAVRNSQFVNLAYADPVSQRYVSVSGFCELVRDRALTQQLWQPGYKAWFPAGLDDPELILLKVNVQQAEYWDPAHGHMVTLLGFPRIM